MNPLGADPRRPPMRSKTELTQAIHRAGRAVAVVNTRSRRAGAAHPRLPALLAGHGVGLTADLPVTEPRRLPDALEAAMAMGPDLLIIGGGDGTLATAVDYLAYRDIALGVLPLGTTNNFARSLGLPLNLRAAVATIATGVVADIDLATSPAPPARTCSPTSPASASPSRSPTAPPTPSNATSAAPPTA